MKYLSFFTALILFITGCGHPQGSLRYYKVSYSQNSYVFFETTLEGLEYRSENVVRGRIAGDFKIISQYTNPFHRTEPSYSCTSVSLEILEVIKGDLRAGDTIRIIEPYVIEKGVLFTTGNYLPSRPGQEYFFFLDGLFDRYFDGDVTEEYIEFAGHYFVLHDERGRYLVPDSGTRTQDFTRAELSLGEDSIDLYMRLYEEVVNAYMRRS